MASTHTSKIELSDGRTVCLSYGVIVAAFIPGKGWLRTDRKFSVTTSKHVNQFMREGTGMGNYNEKTPTPHEELLQLCLPVTSKQ